MKNSFLISRRMNGYRFRRGSFVEFPVANAISVLYIYYIILLCAVLISFCSRVDGETYIVIQRRATAAEYAHHLFLHYTISVHILLPATTVQSVNRNANDSGPPKYGQTTNAPYYPSNEQLKCL